MSLLKKKLFKYRIKLLFNKIKTVVLFVLCYLWLFFPGLVVAFLSKSELLAFLCIIMVIINFNLIDGTIKWFDKLESEQNELYIVINELHYLIEEEESQKRK